MVPVEVLRFPRVRLVASALVAAVAVTCVQVGVPRPVAAAGDRVLVLAGTVTGGSSSIEASEAVADGMAVDVVDATTWSGMTAAQFAAYRAIILGDPTCSGITPDITAAAANSKVWGPTVNGNIVILGTDPVYHATQGGEAVTRRGVDFAVNQVGKTGAYITLSCYYHGTAPNTPVPLLDGVGAGGFTVTGVGCYNNAHIVAVSPALTGLTDADISNWSCSVHEAFQTWTSGLIPLAIAKDFDSSFTASDGTQGPPYILAGGDIRSFPISVTPLNDSAAAGGSHTVSGQILDDVSRNPLIGVKLGFLVTAGPNAGVAGTCSPPACLTDVSGQVAWTYRSNGEAGSDTIKAFYDINANGTPDVGEPQTTAGMQWTPAPRLIINTTVIDADSWVDPTQLAQVDLKIAVTNGDGAPVGGASVAISNTHVTFSTKPDGTLTVAEPVDVTIDPSLTVSASLGTASATTTTDLFTVNEMAECHLPGVPNKLDALNALLDDALPNAPAGQLGRLADRVLNWLGAVNAGTDAYPESETTFAVAYKFTGSFSSPIYELAIGVESNSTGAVIKSFPDTFSRQYSLVQGLFTGDGTPLQVIGRSLSCGGPPA